ncbi:MAG: response regulator [Planctomycetes bacterium]|nr:response regulator [Planctomycetota bacterium]
MNQNAGTILIADDEHHIRCVLGDRLRKQGFVVIEAGDGEEALTLARQHSPLAIVSDVQMPRMTGLEFAQSAKSDSTLATTPFILLTARSYLAAPDQIAATNIHAILAKPFSAREVVDKVMELLNRGQGMRQAA